MRFWPLVLFLAPIVEMYLLFRVAGYVGAGLTVVLVLATAVAGVALLRRQGLATLTRGMARLERGQLPAREVAEGLLLAMAGALLLLPGFVSDAVGFLLLWPAVRAAVAARILPEPPGAGRGPGGDVIEGEFESREEPNGADGDHHGGPPRRLP